MEFARAIADVLNDIATQLFWLFIQFNLIGVGFVFDLANALIKFFTNNATSDIEENAKFTIQAASNFFDLLGDFISDAFNGRFGSREG